MKNGIEDLRNHVFAAMESVLDADKPLDIDRANTVAKLAQVLINSAKVEVDFTEATGLTVTGGFFHKPEKTAHVGQLSAPQSAAAPKFLSGNRG